MSEHKASLVRSWLFAPADVPRRASKALNCAADAAVLDLEDAVAMSHKDMARHMAVERLREDHEALGYVRVNGWGVGCSEDLAVIVGPWLDGIFVPMAEDAQTVKEIDARLSTLESERGLAAGSIDMVLIIESCAGLAHVLEVAEASSRTSRLAFGAGDFTRDLRIEWTRGERELEQARFQIAMASRAANLAAPIDTVFIGLSDHAGMQASVARGVRWGFGSKSCIHPDQVAHIHQGFAPDPQAVEEARAIMEAFAAAEQQGEAALRLNGKLVDYAIVFRARDLVALAERHEQANARATSIL